MNADRKAPDGSFAFDSLFTRYYRRFVRLASSYVGDRMAAEDIVMETMMYCWEHRARLEDGDFSPAYVFAAIRNRCLNFLRDCQLRDRISEQMQEHEAWKRSLQIASLEACNPEELFSAEIERLVNRTLDRLPETTRRIFRMSRFDGKSNREIAAFMKLSVKSVEYHLSKATTALKHSLSDFLPLLIALLVHANLTFPD